MNYSPKLKQAAEEIKAILDKYDIAGLVLLHTPGHGEHVMKINPSYSAARFKPGGELHIHTSIESEGSVEARNKKLQDTSNMFRILADMTEKTFINMEMISEALDEKINASHTDGEERSHDEIVN